jgi:tetratricopeptide (TPR) repeat protein
MYKARLPSMGVRKYKRSLRRQDPRPNVTTRSRSQVPVHRRTTASHSITSAAVQPLSNVQSWRPAIEHPTTPPDSALDPQDIVYYINQYVETRNQARQGFVSSASQDQHTDISHSQLFCKTYKALALLEQAQYQEARALMNEACELVEDVLRSQPTLFFRGFFMVFDTDRWGALSEWRSSLIKYFASMATNVLGSEHALSRILQALRIPDALRNSAEPSLAALLAILDRDCGPVHPETLRTRRNLAIVRRRQDDHHGSEETARFAIELCEQHLGPDHAETLRCHRRLASLYMRRGAFEEAKVILIDALQRAENTVNSLSGNINIDLQSHSAIDAISPIDTLIYASRDLALIATQQNDMKTCREHLRQFQLHLQNHMQGPITASAPQRRQIPSLPPRLTIQDAEALIRDLVMRYDLHCDELASRVMSRPSVPTGTGSA